MFWPGLTGLTELTLALIEGTSDEVLQGLVGITGLRRLNIV